MLRSPQLHARNHPAQILIPALCFGEQRISPTIRARNFCAHMRPYPTPLGGHVKSGNPVHAITIEQRHSRHF
jgi:hypothetical protein